MNVSCDSKRPTDIHISLLTHRFRGGLFPAGDNVPAETAFSQVVQGAEPLGDDVRLLIGGRRRDSKVQMLRGCRHGRNRLQNQSDVSFLAAFLLGRA